MNPRWLFSLVMAIAMAMTLVLGACSAEVELATGEEAPEEPGDDSGDDGTDDGDDSGDDSGDDGGDDVTDDGGEASGDAAAAARALARQLADGPLSLPADEEQCLASALAADAELLEAVSSSVVLQSLSPALQDRLVDVADQCISGGTVAELVVLGVDSGFAEAGLSLTAAQEACLTDGFAARDVKRALLRAGLSGGDLELPADQARAVAAVLAECLESSFLGSVLIDEALGGLADSGIPPTAVDEGCIAGLLDGDLFETFFAAALQGQDFDDLPDAIQNEFILAFVECIDLAQVFQQSFAEEGVVLSDASARCIVDAVVDAGLFEDLITGQEPSDAELGELVIGCLTPAELDQLTG